jgi:trehalose-phosphatase
LDTVRAAAYELSAVAEVVPGAWLEDKGPTLALHYRQVEPCSRGALLDTVRAVAARLPGSIRVDEGRCVFDVRPAGAGVTKATALRDAFAEAGVPGGAMRWYAGDDTTDEDVFAALSPDAVTVYVGDPGGATAARYVAADPGEVVFVLDALRKAAERRPAAGR